VNAASTVPALRGYCAVVHCDWLQVPAAEITVLANGGILRVGDENPKGALA